jgi:hypothetical protein
VFASQQPLLTNNALVIYSSMAKSPVNIKNLIVHGRLCRSTIERAGQKPAARE